MSGGYIGDLTYDGIEAEEATFQFDKFMEDIVDREDQRRKLREQKRNVDETDGQRYAKKYSDHWYNRVRR